MAQLDEAIRAHQQAGAAFQRAADRNGEAWSLTNLSSDLRDARRFAEAIDASERARQALGPDQHLPGLLPEGPARPTGRNILTAFQGLGATYTPHGLRLDRLTSTQRAVLNHLNIALPWPEQGQD